MEKNKKAYAVINNNDEIRFSSSSGGVFSLIAENVLINNGIVYGVRMSEDCRKAQYSRVTRIEDLKWLRGSKYLQACVGDAFQNAKKDLENGNEVLFSGTGCIINAFKLFLGKDYENLLCIDVICHGVPSPLLWQKYIEQIEKKQNKRIVGVNFRCKSEGWRDFGIKQEYCDEVVFSPKKTDPYLQMFLSDYCLRPSCHQCKAKAIRLADITLGDFWGIEHICPSMNDNLGTSFVICRTKNGETVFDRIKDGIRWNEVNYSDVIPYNIAEIRSVYRPKQRETFFIDLKKLTMEQMEKKYLSVPMKDKIKNLVKMILKYKRGVKQ